MNEQQTNDLRILFMTESSSLFSTLDEYLEEAKGYSALEFVSVLASKHLEETITQEERHVATKRAALLTLISLKE